jgi:DNA-binding MarR family transcriptional regulator
MQKLHKVIIRLSKAHRKAAHIEFSKIGLTQGQPKVLDFLVLNNGCIQKDIAENCKIEPATVTSLLANMEKSELVYRTQNSDNRRILNVFLTDKGFAAQKQVTKIFCALDELCFKDFSDKEKNEAINLFTRIQNNLDGKENIDA